MHRTIALLLFIGFAVSAQAADTNNEELKNLLNRNNCSACHQIDKRKYGPVLQEIAERYAGEAGAVDKLAAKIKAGGTGVWGEDIMPPQPNVSDADAKQMAKLILALEPKK
jgi:cytochrome c